MDGAAIISKCQRYRYRLERNLGTGGKIAAIIMVNPSTADAQVDDHSIRKWTGFAGRLGIGRFIVGNKFAYRATDIRELDTCADPIGPDNDRYLAEIMKDADLHIVAWGRLSKLPPRLHSRWREVVRIADQMSCKLFCLGTALDGHPLHPLRLGYDVPLVGWRAPS